jgi:DUF4097 and DUF4098 domain-containing protein YvlB
VHARTGRGSIDVRDAEDRVEARTARGSIEVRFAGEPAGVLTTDRGSIEVQVPRGAGANLDARTARGDVRLDDGLELTGRRERDFARGSLGGGGDRLVLTTGRGDIELARQ